ncbi:hypothetical protein, unlikely [Trypanosoma brucei gambiense DAL972]|uniref:Uncharacterized protein n=1 Tax=Trypanosoma brucei gambiense (strain MHOM/CI/86/DAL972) TaxID=679716 RepID=C9ZQ15_TRYB9|nr:hypothetical protein, unlikely [Trypanosoma brucei gambiense DAL972]CBH11493.1 hypothetical protein, unlikely [Trypanosoma brucei gambiense DAL972]|eukprot:XP_011773780.1 hypothetical protein, unlikely [Trypanosoma brucei gambiense DAL972]
MIREKQTVLFTTALIFEAGKVTATVPAVGNMKAARRPCELAAAATTSYKQPTATTTESEAFNELHALTSALRTHQFCRFLNTKTTSKVVRINHQNLKGDKTVPQPLHQLAIRRKTTG